MKNITVIGGGTGTFTLLQGLKRYPLNISVIFSTADSGGSTGILRDELNILPPGDARQCLIALAKGNETLVGFLKYRFEEGRLEGHNLGNLLIAAMAKSTGDFTLTLSKLAKLLEIKGKIIPVTLKQTNLQAKLINGQIIKGEHYIDEPEHDGNLAIKKLSLVPNKPINPRAVRALREADLIVLGPGDLYTSILPNLLVEGVALAIQKSKAKKIYVGNIMTKWGQTNNFKPFNFVEAVEEYLGKNILDYVIFNNNKPSPEVLKKYARQKEYFVEPDFTGIHPRYQILSDNLLSGKIYKKGRSDRLVRSLIRHDSQKLAQLIVSRCFSDRSWQRVVILDFDHTLFDTNKLREKFISSIREIGLSQKLFLETYKKIAWQKGPYTYRYNPQDHIKLLAKKTKFSEEKIHSQFRKAMSECSECLFKDSLWFLKKLKARGDKLVLLSRGYKHFQAKKIEKSGIKKYFEEIIIIDRDKNHILDKFLKLNQRIIFINDNLYEIERVQKKYSEVFCVVKSRDAKTHTFSDFRSIYRYLFL